MYNYFDYDERLKAMVKYRWDWMSTEYTGISYMLTPNYASDGFYVDNDRTDILSQVNTFVEARHPGLGDNAEEEMGRFVSAMATMTGTRKESICKMSSKTYWQCIGRHDYPALFLCASSINEMVCSSAASERVWSTYRFVHSRLRSQLANDKVEKLAFIYVNCAMLDDKDKSNYMELEGALLSGADCQSDEEN